MDSVPVRNLGRDPEQARGTRDFNDIESRVRRLEDMMIKLVAAVEKHAADSKTTE